jgi:hypothetical protein
MGSEPPKVGNPTPRYCRDQSNAQPDHGTRKHLPFTHGLVRKRPGHSFRHGNSLRSKPKCSSPCISLLAVFSFPRAFCFLAIVSGTNVEKLLSTSPTPAQCRKVYDSARMAAHFRSTENKELHFLKQVG